MNKKKPINKVKLVRNISGTILILICSLLIFIFGLMPLFKCKICAIDTKTEKSVISKGSLVLIHEVDGAKLDKNDVVVYYVGKNAIGVKVNINDVPSSQIYAMGKDDIMTSVKYRKISGKVVGVPIPFLGTYANWLVKGSGLLDSVILNGILFMVFAVSALLTKEETI